MLIAKCNCSAVAPSNSWEGNPLLDVAETVDVAFDLGGAAVHRCDHCIVMNPALAAEAFSPGNPTNKYLIRLPYLTRLQSAKHFGNRKIFPEAPQIFYCGECVAMHAIDIKRSMQMVNFMLNDPCVPA